MAEGDVIPGPVKVQEIELASGKALYVVAETMEGALALLYEFAEGYIEHLVAANAKGDGH